MANRTHIRVKDARSAKKLISQLINRRNRDEIDSQKARDLGYLLKIFIEIHNVEELEERINKLEETSNDADNKS